MMTDLTVPALLATVLLLLLIAVYLFSPDEQQRDRARHLLRRLFRL